MNHDPRFGRHPLDAALAFGIGALFGLGAAAYCGAADKSIVTALMVVAVLVTVLFGVFTRPFEEER